jgi:hypothetical protein
MRDVDVAVVPVADRVGRAGDRLPDAERTGCAPDEGRLPRAELAGDGDDVARTELARKLGGDRLRLGLRRRLALHYGRLDARSVAASGRDYRLGTLADSQTRIATGADRR